jgi:predicted hydrocarbon binding protein
MSKFKIGDKVKRVTVYGFDNAIVKGGIYTVSGVNKYGDLSIEGAGDGYDADCFELVEHPKFKAMLFQSNSEQEAYDIQTALFEAGYKWASREESVQYPSATYFSTNTDGTMYHMDDANELVLLNNRDKYTTCKVERKLSIVEEVEKVAYAGKLYNKKDFEAAIATLSALD